MNALDKLLSEPLAAVPDQGFSSRVVRRVQWELLGRRWTTVVLVVLLAAMVLLTVPLGSLGFALGVALPRIASLWEIQLAASLVAVSVLAACELPRFL